MGSSSRYGPRYPDLNEPVVIGRLRYKVMSLLSGEFVECPTCSAILRKPAVRAHHRYHLTVTTALREAKQAVVNPTTSLPREHNPEGHGFF